MNNSLNTNNTTTTDARELDPKEIALAQMLGLDPNATDEDGEYTYQPEEASYDHLGLTVYEVDGNEYAVGDDDECDAAAYDQIRESVWAFNASFLASYTKAPEEMIEGYQRDKSEDANEGLLNMIEDFTGFADDAISAGGRGAFLTSYDGNELEAQVDGDWYLGYRLN
jgi:hypothetical protein